MLGLFSIRKQLLSDVDFKDQGLSQLQPGWSFLTFVCNALYIYLRNIVCANCWFILFPISLPSSIFPSHKTYKTYGKI